MYVCTVAAHSKRKRCEIIRQICFFPRNITNVTYPIEQSADAVEEKDGVFGGYVADKEVGAR